MKYLTVSVRQVSSSYSIFNKEVVLMKGLAFQERLDDVGKDQWQWERLK